MGCFSSNNALFNINHFNVLVQVQLRVESSCKSLAVWKSLYLGRAQELLGVMEELPELVGAQMRPSAGSSSLDFFYFDQQ